MMDNVFIGYNVTILPNVRIGENVIIGACSTITKDCEANSVYAGSPAKKIGSFDAFVEKCSKKDGENFDYPFVRQNQHPTQTEIDYAWQFFSQQHSKGEGQ